ncbi:MAG: hypothetical protein HYX43_20425 [Burkholderiales bacterium]|nr:hypothetical protein [Burkholderiales bacterium]
MHSSRGGDSRHSTPVAASTANTPASSSTAQSFGQYSHFLRSAVADEESLQVGESLQALAVQIEALVSLLQPARGGDPQRLATALIDLVGDLRTHRALLLGLGVDWHRFFEFDAHFAALNQFRIQVTQWAMEAAPPTRSTPALADFDLAAWRVLGAGSLLLDVYEQSKLSAQAPDEGRRPPSFWARWRAWWKRRSIRRQVVRKGGSRGRRRTD